MALWRFINLLLLLAVGLLKASACDGQVSDWSFPDNSGVAFHPFSVGKWVAIHVFYMDNGGGDHLSGWLGLREAVWRHRSKSVCTDLAFCDPVCDDSATEGGMAKCGTISMNFTFI